MDAGEVVYKALVPTIKVGLCITAGFVLTRTGCLSPASTRGISMITLNLSLPALIFSSMVLAFNSQSVKAFGPLVMVGVIYETLGALLAFVVREVCFVPTDFRWGIIVSGAVSNWGNLPVSVVQTIAKQAPFREGDVELGVAYISTFILVMNTTFFGFGLHKMCAWDFVEPHVTTSQPPGFKKRWGQRLSKLRRVLGRRSGPPATLDVKDSVGRSSAVLKVESEKMSPAGGQSGHVELNRMRSPIPSLPATLPLEGGGLTESPFQPLDRTSSPRYTLDARAESSSRPPSSRGLPIDEATGTVQQRSLLQKALAMLSNTPMATWSVWAGLLFSLVSPLKALMTDVDGWTGSRMPNAPDGNPPLSFVLETAAYIGQLTVPLGLMLLGSSFARLQIPSRLRDLPLTAILAMLSVKIFAVFVVQVLQDHTSMFPQEDKIRTFCALLLSGTPAAVNQLVVTQLYNPAGTAHTLAAFLLAQYLAMFVLSTGLAAIALYIVK